MRHALLALALPFMLSPLTACMSLPDPARADVQAPALDLVTYFTGRTYAAGIFENRGDNLSRTLYVTIDGTWDPATRRLVLDERFIYNDGQTQQRIWTFAQRPDGSWTGTAPDVNGEAHLRVAGAGGVFTYPVDLQLSGGRSVEVRFHDRLWRLEGDMIINRATVSKFGVRLGEATLVFFKEPPPGFPVR
jgi:hypothetical protein